MKIKSDDTAAQARLTNGDLVIENFNYLNAPSTWNWEDTIIRVQTLVQLVLKWSQCPKLGRWLVRIIILKIS